MNLNKIIKDLDQLLDVTSFNDYSVNGLQVNSGNNEIKKVCLAVDSGLSVIKEACKQDSDLLIVHHGMFWGQKQNLINGIIGEKVRTLINSGCSLYASHLPLDAHLEYGNNICLLKEYKLDFISTFANFDGKDIGVLGDNSQNLNFNDFINISENFLASGPIYKYNFGDKEIKTVGIVSGSGSAAVTEAAEKNIDLLISGEPKQEVYHLAKELKVNLLFIGHYCSETFGVKALGSYLQPKYKIDTFFYDEPTNI